MGHAALLFSPMRCVSTPDDAVDAGSMADRASDGVTLGARRTDGAALAWTAAAWRTLIESTSSRRGYALYSEPGRTASRARMATKSVKAGLVKPRPRPACSARSRAAAPRPTAVVLLGILSTSACWCQPQSPTTQPLSARVDIGCGASVERPPASSATPAQGPPRGVRFTGLDDTTCSAWCVDKAESAPSLINHRVAWELEAIHDKDPSVNADTFEFSRGPAIEEQPTMVVEFVSTRSGTRTAMTFSERRRGFYWTRCTAPQASWARGAGVRDAFVQSLRVTDSPAGEPIRWWRPPIVTATMTLAQARAGFETQVPKGRPAKGYDGLPAPVPPRGVFQRVNVAGPAGRLVTYLTPDPKDGKKHPAVVWAHGGFGGIDDWFWTPAKRSNDQTAGAFREAGIVLAVGSWRAENDNPGDYQLYYGEVDDFLAIRDHVARLPYVDPDRIYLAGHSSGGTLVLLAAELSDQFRAAFSIGGDPVFSPEGYERFGGVPFDSRQAQEVDLRSSASFVHSIRRPTFYFEGRSVSVGAAQWMADEAARRGTPFKAFVALHANHFDILAPLTELLARKILTDTATASGIEITQEEIDNLVVEE